MFSITKFIFGQDPVLKEGGNTRALVRDPETGDLIKVSQDGGPKVAQVKKFRGREAFAEEIDLTTPRITRQEFRANCIDMFKVLDREFLKDHGRHLWDPSQRDQILNTGFSFGGSSEHLFAPPEVIPDEEFIEFKPKSGDLDQTVPLDTKEELFRTLNRLEDKQLTPIIAYIGHNKESPKSDSPFGQINALFAYTWDPSAPEGEGDTFFQVDLVFAEYVGGRPSEWTKFSHSSPWRDIVAGVKGFAHKILLASLASVRSPPPINARLATPSATAEKPAISMTADPHFISPTPEEVEQRVTQRVGEILKQPGKSPEAARKEAESLVAKEIKRASKRPARVRSMLSFDVESGLSPRYQKLDWEYNGDEVYRYLSRAERTGAIRDIRLIFENLLGSNPPPTSEDLKNFESFLGILEIMKDRLSPQEIVKVYEEMAYRLFGSGAQQISATDPLVDQKAKNRIIEIFRSKLPEVEASTIDLDKMKGDFYAKYRIRGQEGYIEDRDQPRVDESKKSNIDGFIKITIGD